MSAVSALEALQLQLLERWSSLLLRTFASMMAEHATTEPVRPLFKILGSSSAKAKRYSIMESKWSRGELDERRHHRLGQNPKVI